MYWNDMMNWHDYGFWEWVGVVVAVLVAVFILRNLRDLARYIRIRSM